MQKITIKLGKDYLFIFNKRKIIDAQKIWKTMFMKRKKYF